MVTAGVTPSLNEFNPVLHVVSSASIMRWYIGCLFVDEMISGPKAFRAQAEEAVLARGYTLTAYWDGVLAMWIITLVCLLSSFALMYRDLKKNGK